MRKSNKTTDIFILKNTSVKMGIQITVTSMHKFDTIGWVFFWGGGILLICIVVSKIKKHRS